MKFGKLTLNGKKMIRIINIFIGIIVGVLIGVIIMFFICAEAILGKLTINKLKKVWKLLNE